MSARSRSSSLSPAPLWDAPQGFVIRFPRTDGSATRRPAKLDPTPLADGSIDYMITMGPDHPKNLHWRKAIGKHIAEHVLKLDPKDPWIIEDFPEGYQLFDHLKGKPDDPRHDAYLFGSRTVDKFRSPNEFYLHSQWLFLNEDLNAVKCTCKWCGKTNQGEINRIYGGTFRDGSSAAPRSAPRIRPAKSARPPRPPKPPKPPRPATSLPAARRAVRPRTPTPASPPRPMKSANQYRINDLRAASGGRARSRLGELVWCSLENAIEGSESWQKIELWPAIVEENKVFVTYPDHGRSPLSSRHVEGCKVKLLGVMEALVLPESAILPFQAYAVPRILADWLWAQPPPPPSLHLSPDLRELNGFKPWCPSAGDDSASAPIKDRTFAHAALSYALALRMNAEIIQSWCQTDPYSCLSPSSVQSSPMSDIGKPEPLSLSQGLWWGAERIWQDDLVRINIPWHLLPYGQMRKPSEGAEGRGLFMRLDSIWTAVTQDGDQTRRLTYIGGQLFEVATDPLPMNIPPVLGVVPNESAQPMPLAPNGISSHIIPTVASILANQPTHPSPNGSNGILSSAVPAGPSLVTGSAVKPELVVESSKPLPLLSSPSIPGSYDSTGIANFALPPAPFGCVFLPLLPDGDRLEVSLAALAGRYYPTLMTSPLADAVRRPGRNGVESRALDALGGLLPGHQCCMRCDKWVWGRSEVLKRAERTARRDLATAWGLIPADDGGALVDEGEPMDIDP